MSNDYITLAKDPNSNATVGIRFGETKASVIYRKVNEPDKTIIEGKPTLRQLLRYWFKHRK